MRGHLGVRATTREKIQDGGPLKPRMTFICSQRKQWCQPNNPSNNSLSSRSRGHSPRIVLRYSPARVSVLNGAAAERRPATHRREAAPHSRLPTSHFHKEWKMNFRCSSFDEESRASLLLRCWSFLGPKRQTHARRAPPAMKRTPANGKKIKKLETATEQIARQKLHFSATVK